MIQPLRAFASELGTCVWGFGWPVTLAGCAHADVCDLGWVIWRRSSCEEGEGPGAKLAAA